MLNFFGSAEEEGPSKKHEEGLSPEAAAAARQDQAKAAMGDADEDTKVEGLRSMPDGDYLVHIHVQKAKRLCLDDDDTCDPFVRVKILDNYQSTKALNDVARDATVTYDEHMFMEFKEMTQEKMEEANVIFSVENRGFFKGDLIGQFEIAVNKIYNMDNHVMKNQMIALNDPDGSDFSKITGYIAVSIQVQGPGDEAIELNLGTKEQLEKKKPLVPTQIKKEYKQAFIRFYIMENLPKMDYNLIGPEGTIDAFCKVTYAGTTQRVPSGSTKYKTMENNRVILNEEMRIPIELPLREETIKMQLWDWDTLVDEFVCSLELKVNNILKYERTGDPKDESIKRTKWINFYGPPDGATGSNADKMRRDSTIASRWMGRMLVEYFCLPEKYPIFKTMRLKGDQGQELVNATLPYVQTNRKFKIILEFGSGICLPDTKKYNLKLSIANWSRVAEPVETKRNYCRWDKRRVEEVEFSYQEMKAFPTLYVYLMDGDTPICFYRESVLQFTKYKVAQDNEMPAEEGPYHWLQFEPDLALGYVTNPMFAGMFSMRLYIHDITTEGPFDETAHAAWKKKPPTRLNAFRMRAAIYQCESLPPEDEEGNSDPYIEVWSGSEQRCRTVTCQDTNNPIYYQVKEFTMQFKESALDCAMPIVLNVWDEDNDLFDNSDDMIGRAVIFLPKLIKMGKLSKDDTVPEPTWFPIKKCLNDAYDKETGAAVLASFQYHELDERYAIEADEIELDNIETGTKEGIPYIPDLQIVEYKVEIICLGLRNLISTGILPVNKAFIKFNLKSLLPSSKANAVQNIETQPKERGSNPNMRTTIQFEVQMPSDTTFCPRMNCETYDMVFAGLAQPLIGSFILDLGTYNEKQKEHVALMLEELEKTSRALQKILTVAQGQDATGQKVDVFSIIHNSGDMDKSSLRRSQKSSIQTKKDSNKAGARVLAEFKQRKLQLPDSNAKRKVPQAKAPESQAIQQEDQDAERETMFVQAVGVEADGQIPGGRGPALLQQRTTSLLDDKRTDAQKLEGALGSQMRKKVKAAYEAEQLEKKAKLENERNMAQLALARKRPDANKNRINPLYRMDKRLNVQVEYDKPPDSLFMQVGFDTKPGSKEKHYRRYYADELENIEDKDGDKLVDAPFITADMFRAKEAKKTNLLAQMFGGGGDEGPMTTYLTGQFKGIVRCYRESEKKETDQQLKEGLKQTVKLVQQIFEIATGREVNKWNELIGLLETNEAAKVDHTKTDSLLEWFNHNCMILGLSALNIKKLVCDIIFEHQLMAKMNEIVQAKVRVYMLSGFNMAKRDLFSKSDPYLILKCGKTEYNERDNYQLDEDNPEFYKSYDFMVDLPGAPVLEIEVWDYDGLFGDEIIGKSILDLDDRYYSLTWQSIQSKPIEYRDLFHYQTTVTQGVVKMWVEINNKDSKQAMEDPMNVHPEPTVPLEMRVVVWKTKEIPNMDVEGCSDIQCKAYLDAETEHFTDTHWRCQNGAGSFNYRMKIKCDSKQPDLTLRVEAWDRDIIKSNDMIGGFSLDLRDMRKDVLLTSKKSVLHQKYWEDYLKHQLLAQGQEQMANKIYFEDGEKEKFWVPCLYENTETGHLEERGSILISVHLLLQEHADIQEQGIGRQEPNSEPHCPEPEGRIKLTFNPIEMFFQLVPAKAIRQIMYYAICVGCCALCLMMLPNILSNLLTHAIIGG